LAAANRNRQQQHPLLQWQWQLWMTMKLLRDSFKMSGWRKKEVQLLLLLHDLEAAAK
jgi:hypothetical protein